MFSSDINDWKALDAFTGPNPPDVEALCAIIARIMGVNMDGVGLLKVRGLSLEFVYPFALKSAGRIPLSSSAVAANTATSKKAEVFNNFAKVSHNSVFELVPLGGSAKTNTDPQRIQKLMSVPVVDTNHKVIGVVQISRKGRTRDDAGFDFTDDDLQSLCQVAQRLSAPVEKL
jgi:GAF domain